MRLCLSVSLLYSVFGFQCGIVPLNRTLTYSLWDRWRWITNTNTISPIYNRKQSNRESAENENKNWLWNSLSRNNALHEDIGSRDGTEYNQITHFESRRIVIIARPNVIIISVILSLIIVVTFFNIVFFSLHAFMVTISIDRSIHFSSVFVNFFFLSSLIAKRKATRFWISIVIIVAVVGWFQILVYFFSLFWKLKTLETMLTIIESIFICIMSRFVLWAPRLC